MLEHQPEIRRELAANRADDLRRAAAGARARGHVRRTIGSGFVCLGLRLAHDGEVSLLVRQLHCQEEAPNGVSSVALSRA